MEIQKKEKNKRKKEKESRAFESCGPITYVSLKDQKKKKDIKMEIRRNKMEFPKVHYKLHNSLTSENTKHGNWQSVYN